jgi:protein-S-isoprenylcysteine O-methyltransferase Ste14
VSAKWISIVAFAMAVVGIVVLAMIERLFTTNLVSIAVQGAAVALLIWARVAFGLRSFHAGADPTAGGLVTRGPYRYLRHPIYAAILYFVWAGVLPQLSPGALAAAVLVTGGLVVRLLLEERLVAERYPEYADYAARTKRLIPYLL